MAPQKKREFDDFDRDKRAIANIGKRFYTWATLGTLAGATFLVGGLWQMFQRFGGETFKAQTWPLIFSVIIIGLFAFATEPSKAQRTELHQKFQKALIAVANMILVFFTVVGGTTIIT